MKAPPPLTFILFLAVVGLAWTAWQKPPEFEVADAVPGAKAATSSSEDVAEKAVGQYARRLRPELYYRAITDRPLFSPTRRPHDFAPPALLEETVVEADANPEPDELLTGPPDVILKGVMFSDAHKSALISVDGAAADWLDDGVLIEEWRLQINSPAEILLERGEDAVRVGLYED